MLQINGKTFMNLQEAVQWLLDNNALPFQSSANYVANTEIGMGTIVNPSPAKVRIGSLIFFADSKVSTVTGLTENGFIVSDQYNDLVDDVVYVSNVALDASGHLIVTLSNGQNIDAGLIKQVTGFSINGSQHLIVSFNDGSSTDLGAIFSGNITISGDLTVTGTVDGATITGNSIVEKMSGYSFTKSSTDSDIRFDSYIYAGVVKNGNKLTLALGLNFTRLQDLTNYKQNKKVGVFTLPVAVANLLYPSYSDVWFGAVMAPIKCLASDTSSATVALDVLVGKTANALDIYAMGLNDLTLNKTYYLRFEITFLLSENLAS